LQLLCFSLNHQLLNLTEFSSLRVNTQRKTKLLSAMTFQSLEPPVPSTSVTKIARLSLVMVTLQAHGLVLQSSPFGRESRSLQEVKSKRDLVIRNSGTMLLGTSRRSRTTRIKKQVTNTQRSSLIPRSIS